MIVCACVNLSFVLNAATAAAAGCVLYRYRRLAVVRLFDFLCANKVRVCSWQMGFCGER